MKEPDTHNVGIGSGPADVVTYRVIIEWHGIWAEYRFSSESDAVQWIKTAHPHFGINATYMLQKWRTVESGSLREVYDSAYEEE